MSTMTRAIRAHKRENGIVTPKQTKRGGHSKTASGRKAFVDTSESAYGNLTYDPAQKAALEATKKRREDEAREVVPNRQQRRLRWPAKSKAGWRKRQKAKNSYIAYIDATNPKHNPDWVIDGSQGGTGTVNTSG